MKSYDESKEYAVVEVTTQHPERPEPRTRSFACADVENAMFQCERILSEYDENGKRCDDPSELIGLRVIEVLELRRQAMRRILPWQTQIVIETEEDEDEPCDE